MTTAGKAKMLKSIAKSKAEMAQGEDCHEQETAERLINEAPPVVKMVVASSAQMYKEHLKEGQTVHTDEELRNPARRGPCSQQQAGDFMYLPAEGIYYDPSNIASGAPMDVEDAGPPMVVAQQAFREERGFFSMMWDTPIGGNTDATAQLAEWVDVGGHRYTDAFSMESNPPPP